MFLNIVFQSCNVILYESEELSLNPQFPNVRCFDLYKIQSGAPYECFYMRYYRYGQAMERAKALDARIEREREEKRKSAGIPDNLLQINNYKEGIRNGTKN